MTLPIMSLRERLSAILSEKTKSKAERLQKQSKNFGAELEFGSTMDNQDEDLVRLISDITGEHFPGYNTIIDEGESDGKERDFILSSDNTAEYIGSMGSDELYSYTEDIVNGIYDGDFDEGFTQDIDDLESEARSNVDRYDYDNDEDYDNDIYHEIDRLNDELLDKIGNKIYSILLNTQTMELAGEVRNIIRNRLDTNVDKDLLEEELHNILSSNRISKEMSGSEYFPHGVEFITPRLHLSQDVINKLSKVFKGISDLEDTKMHKNAGLHVHMGVLDDMEFIHLLRMAYYLNEKDIEEVAGREFTGYAKSVDEFISPIKDVMRGFHTDRGRSHEIMNDIIDELLRTRSLAVNFTNLDNGTLEFRIGSSTLAEDPEKFILYMNTIKDAIDYGVNKDYLELDGYKLFMNDNGSWKSVDENGNVFTGSAGDRYKLDKLSKKDDTSSFNTKTSEEKELRIWEKIVKRYKDNPKVIEKLKNGLEYKAKRILSSGSAFGLPHTNEYEKFMKTGDLKYIGDLLENNNFLNIKDIIEILQDDELLEEFNMTSLKEQLSRIWS